MMKARLEEDDGAPIVLVSNAPPEGLVDGAEGLFLVPLLAVEETFLSVGGSFVVVFALEDDLFVPNARIGNADGDDGPGVLIHKVQALTDFTSEDGKEDGPGASTCF